MILTSHSVLYNGQEAAVESTKMGFGFLKTGFNRIAWGLVNSSSPAGVSPGTFVPCFQQAPEMTVRMGLGWETSTLGTERHSGVHSRCVLLGDRIGHAGLQETGVLRPARHSEPPSQSVQCQLCHRAEHLPLKASVPFILSRKILKSPLLSSPLCFLNPDLPSLSYSATFL